MNWHLTLGNDEEFSQNKYCLSFNDLVIVFVFFFVHLIIRRTTQLIRLNKTKIIELSRIVKPTAKWFSTFASSWMHFRAILPKIPCDAFCPQQSLIFAKLSIVSIVYFRSIFRLLRTSYWVLFTIFHWKTIIMDKQLSEWQLTAECGAHNPQWAWANSTWTWFAIHEAKLLTTKFAVSGRNSTQCDSAHRSFKRNKNVINSPFIALYFRFELKKKNMYHSKINSSLQFHDGFPTISLIFLLFGIWLFQCLQKLCQIVFLLVLFILPQFR